MTASHTRVLSRRAGALLGAITVLAAGCTAAGGGSGPRADQAGAAPGTVAASPSGHSFAHRTGGTTGPGVRHGGGSRIAPARSLPPCAYTAGHPVATPGGAAPSSPVAIAVCWCACARDCCGCGLSRWPPRSHLAWLCCPRWLGPPGGDSSPVRLACGLGCGSFGCPAGPQAPGLGPARSAAGSVQARSPRGVAAGAS